MSKNFLSGLLTPIASEIKNLEKYLDIPALSNLGFCSATGPLLATINSHLPCNCSNSSLTP